ncbi:hypothetical protein NDU88_003716 [Pleurodeles waltl]|uniref:Secreted protein n=1 Tax=Pleurodeles waltl TaxID=8319 RepID=A0AAV7QCH4_PLEWA|nr:hypothetical protein NDU88_003716 [Pleurodeles waltl]
MCSVSRAQRAWPSAVTARVSASFCLRLRHSRECLCAYVNLSLRVSARFCLRLRPRKCAPEHTYKATCLPASACLRLFVVYV